MFENLTTTALSYLEPILMLVIQIIGVAVLGLLGAFLNHLRSKSKFSKLFEKTKLDETIINSAEKDINKVVVAVNQKLVSSMKKLNADGKLTDEEKEEVFNTAKDTAVALLNSETLNVITGKYGGLNKWLETTIEYAVGLNKPSDSELPEHEEKLPVVENIETYEFPLEDGE